MGTKPKRLHHKGNVEMNHWETHLYGFAVALTQGKKIKPENLQGMRDKAIKHGHTEEECVFVEGNAQLYIAKGVSNLDENRENVEIGRAHV